MINVVQNYADIKGTEWGETFKLIELVLLELGLSLLVTGSNNQWKNNSIYLIR